MPRKKSAIKALKQSKKLAEHNKEIKDNVKNLIKKTKKAVEAKEGDKVLESIKSAIKAIDKAAQKKIIKKNTAARKKSRLMKKVNSLKKQN
ncbi:MAG: 30S ribosomal protein S20 [bacterium]